MISAFKRRGDRRRERETMEPDLFANHEAGARRNEDQHLHAAIVFLRSIGFRPVRISGAQSKISGHLLTNAQVKGFAREKGWRG